MAMWEVGRFARTLVEFEVLPWSGCVKFWLGFLSGRSPHQPPVVSSGGMLNMGQILVIGGDRPENQAIAAVLTQKGYQVQRQDPTLVTETSLEDHDIAILCFDLDTTAIQSCLRQMESLTAWRSPSWTLFDFRQPNPTLTQLWGAVDDVVMGGVSASRLQLTHNLAYFTGNVSTANNGGFASVRTKNFPSPWDLSAYGGFRLRVKGDGQRYKLIARCEGRWDGVGYSFSFDTLADQWMTVDIPFTALIPVFRAKSVPEMGAFDPQRVYALQLMLSKFEYDGQLNPTFKSGGFSLGIAAISVYGGQPFPRCVLLAKNTALLESLREGHLPYCLLHNDGGFSPMALSFIVDTIGDRQKTNQVIPLPDSPP